MSVAIFAFYLMSLVSTSDTADEQCKVYQVPIRGKALRGHTYKRAKAGELFRCYVRCERDPACKSCNFKHGQEICEMNNETKESKPQDFITDEQSYYIKRTGGDVDECTAFPNICGANTDCHNTDGSYTCICKAGYTGDGKSCFDIDECYAGNECSANALCHNLHGSYNCTCKEGYYGDGKNCTAGSSCENITAIIGEKAINGSYFLIQDGVKFEVYCHIESEDQVWTLIARSSNNDSFRNWMRKKGHWWFTKEKSVGQTANTSANSDLLSPAFWLVSGHEFKITRSDDPQHTALLRTSGDCLGGQTFRAKISSYGQFIRGESWEIKPKVDGCRGSCNVSYAGRFEETVGFKQAKCSGKVQSADKIGFWCAIESSGSVMMIGGGGQPCTLGDHGIGITGANGRSFDYTASTKRNDFGDVATSSPETSYSLNLWIQ